jgi:hypothetical protein
MIENAREDAWLDRGRTYPVDDDSRQGRIYNKAFDEEEILAKDQNLRDCFYLGLCHGIEDLDPLFNDMHSPDPQQRAYSIGYNHGSLKSRLPGLKEEYRTSTGIRIYELKGGRT